MIRHFYLIIVFTLAQFSSFAQSNFHKYEFGIKSENDAYLAIKQDQYYTNGIFFYFRSALNPTKKQDTSKLIKKIWSINGGQKMYNAYSGSVANIYFIDRPFAAYLYAGTSLQWLFKNENSIKFEVQAGTIGPAALGKEAQELYHTIFDFYDVNGWQHQIKNEFGVNLTLNYDKLIHRSKSKKLDIILPLEARIGNTFSGFKPSLLIRTGNLNPLYHSSTTNSHVSNNYNSEIKDKEFFLFIKPSLDFVLYDATVSGGLFRNNKGDITYSTKPLVFSQEIGLNYTYNRLTANFSIIFKTKELKSKATAHQYGIIDLFYRFN